MRDGRSRSQCCESALDAFTLAVQCGGYDVSVVRQWPRARFRRAVLASVAVRPHGQGVSAPGPACNATRFAFDCSRLAPWSPEIPAPTRCGYRALLPNGVVVEVPEHTERAMCATVLERTSRLP